MGTRKYKPTSPGKRSRQVNDYADITTKKPFKGLLKSKKNHAGRNQQGKISVRSRGTGNKKFIRIIDFKRVKENVPGTIVSIEYDPNRSAFISLVHYADGEKSYIITPLKMKVGDKIISSTSAEIKVGNTIKVDKNVIIKLIAANLGVFPITPLTNKNEAIA